MDTTDNKAIAILHLTEAQKTLRAALLTIDGLRQEFLNEPIGKENDYSKDNQII